tara:strand:+ start:33 stop:1112 length:1080 start_codon:yes stop_codon:yes gene_type:complete
MTDEEIKAEAIEWAKRQPDFPKRMDWVIDHYEEGQRPPCGYKKLDKLFGSYNNFRREAGAPILLHDSSETVTLEVLKLDCKEEMLSKNPDIVTPCWVWQKTTSKGYALKSIEDKNWSVHIYVHEVLGNNPNPSTEEETYTVDHICRIKNCINPDHLQWATGSEQRKNQTRGKNTKPSVNPPPASCLEERLNWYQSQCDVDANGCWIPPNKPRDDEYIHIQYKDKTESTAKNYRLHILSALQNEGHPLNREYYESFTTNHKVLHKCPVKPPDKRCCNPDHLEIWEGEAANRQNTLDTRGYHAGVKLKKKEIPEIREIYHDCLELGWNKMKIYHHIGSIYEVAESTVVHAVKGTKYWKDIE